MSADLFIPPLCRFSGSWIVTDRETGKAVAEFFNRSTVEKINHRRYCIKTAFQYLVSLNQ